VIGRAINTFPTFLWAKIEHITGEITKYHAAAILVNGNRYYGFKKDLGAAKSTNYKNLGWVANELLLRCNGEVSLKGYHGWIRVPTKAAIADIVN